MRLKYEPASEPLHISDNAESQTRNAGEAAELDHTKFLPRLAQYDSPPTLNQVQTYETETPNQAHEFRACVQYPVLPFPKAPLVGQILK